MFGVSDNCLWLLTSCGCTWPRWFYSWSSDVSLDTQQLDTHRFVTALSRHRIDANSLPPHTPADHVVVSFILIEYSPRPKLSISYRGATTRHTNKDSLFVTYARTQLGTYHCNSSWIDFAVSHYITPVLWRCGLQQLLWRSHQQQCSHRNVIVKTSSKWR